MGNNEFEILALGVVKDYIEEHLDKSEEKPFYEVFIVWSCKTLQNNKALISSSLSDGMYYECTYNGDKKELYLDAFKKFENRCINMKEDWKIAEKEEKEERDEETIPRYKIREKIKAFQDVKKEIIKNENKLSRASITYDIVRNDYCEKMLKELLEENNEKSDPL